VRRFIGTAMAVLGAAAIVFTAADAVQAQSKRKRERERPQVAQPVDRRDRLVSLASSPFNGRPYWQALGRCGGVYFKLGTLASDAAINAQVVRKDKASHDVQKKRADAARKIATSFFEGAERVLIADRKLTREEAVLIYDTAASDAGDRVKTVEAGLQEVRACPALYEACHIGLSKVCTDTLAVMN
jgi:hypothetical protein